MTRTKAVSIDVDTRDRPRFATPQTAACLLDWSGSRAKVAAFRTDLRDGDLLELLDDERVTKVGIDAPFGWPLGFVRAVNGYSRTGRWPAAETRLLALRETDRWVREITGRDPLSVSTDKISFTAMRCARLLTMGARVGRVRSEACRPCQNDRRLDGLVSPSSRSAQRATRRDYRRSSCSRSAESRK